MKKLLYGVAGLVALLVAAILIVPMFVDANAFKGEIAARVKEATGRDLVIEGDIAVRFLVPATGVSVSGVRFANLPGAVAADMVTLESLEVNVALLPLLRGEIQVESIRLVEPVIELEVLQDGRVNWNFGDAGEGAGGDGDGEPGSGGDGGAVRIDDMVIENGTLTYRDARSGTLEFVEHLDARLSAGSLQGPFTIQGAAVVRNLPASFNVSIGRMVPGRSVPLKLTLEVGEGAARLGFTGSLSEVSAQGTLDGTLKASGPDLRDLVDRASAALGGSLTLPSLLAQGFELESTVTASATAANLNDITLVFGEVRASGAVSASLEAPIRIDATLTLNRLDLDALLAAAEGTAPGRREDPATAASGPAAGAFALPGDIDASLALSIDAVSYRGGVIRQAQAAVTLTDGRLHLTRAGALLPGGSDIQLVGALAAVDGQPVFDGAIEVTSDNLRGLLKWLDIDLGQVPTDRFRKFSLSSSVRATPELAQAYEIDLRLDTSRLTGAAAYAFRARPSFSADIVLDRLNVDAYLPPTGAAEAKPDTSAGEGASGAGAPGPLAALELFDTNFKARVDKLVVNELQVSGLVIDLSLIGGVLTVRRAAFADLAGARGALSGVARDFQTTPTFDVSVDLRARDLGRLMRAAGLTPAPEVASLGAAVVKGGVKGSLDDLDLDLDIAAAGGTVELKGGLKKGMTEPRFDFLLDARHPDLVGLANGFGAGLKRGQGADGPLRVKGKVSGDMEAMKLDLAVEAAGARMKVAGDLVAVATAPRFDLRLDIAHPSYVKLGGAFGVPLKPAPGTGDGPVKVTGKVAGTLEAMTMDLSITAAGADLKIAGNLAGASTAPRLDVRLDASHPSLARLARTFDAGLRPTGGAKDGPVSVKGRIAGPLSLLQLDLSVAAAGATVKVAGSLAAESVKAMRYNLDIEARHADVSGFARTIGVDYRPAAVNLGGLALRGHLAGGAGSASLDNLDGNLGPVNLKGVLNARWDGARPAISGVLNTSEIIVDLFLPRAAGRQAGAAGATATAGGAPGRWSREPIDITWLRAFDADLKLASRGIVFQGYEFREPKVTIKLSNGRLDIDPLTGKLFDGDVILRTWVRQTSPPSIGVGLKIKNGDVFKALVRTAQIDTVSGRFVFDGRFQSAGRSQLEMISALSGRGSFNVRDGFVKGFDLRALSDRLGRLNSLIDFAGLIDNSMRGGRTRLISVDGTYQAARGVIRTTDTRTVLDGGRGTTVGTVDLPRWRMNIENRFRLTDHPKAPAFGVDLVGPLDAPRRDLKTGQLQQFIAARVGGTVLRKTLGQDGVGGVLGGVLGTLGGGQAQPSAPQPTQPAPTSQPAQQPSSPLDELIKGLGGILGGGN